MPASSICVRGARRCSPIARRCCIFPNTQPTAASKPRVPRAGLPEVSGAARRRLDHPHHCDATRATPDGREPPHPARRSAPPEPAGGRTHRGQASAEARCASFDTQASRTESGPLASRAGRRERRGEARISASGSSSAHARRRAAGAGAIQGPIHGERGDL